MVYSTQKESDRKRFVGARAIRAAGEKRGKSGLFGNWGKGTALPLLVPPAPPVWQGGGSLQPPRADTGL